MKDKAQQFSAVSGSKERPKKNLGPLLMPILYLFAIGAVAVTCLKATEWGINLIAELFASVSIGSILFIVTHLSVGLSHDTNLKEKFGGQEKYWRVSAAIAFVIALVNFILELFGAPFIILLGLPALRYLFTALGMSKARAADTTGALITIFSVLFVIVLIKLVLIMPSN